MGGDMDLTRAADKQLLDALADYVNHGIPFARSPEVGPGSGLPIGQRSAAATRGEAVFTRLTCPTCHTGSRYTDSGSGNPSLTLSGTVTLHDVGTCDGTSTPFPDQTILAADGTPRPSCEFDTPSLNGVFDTAPYFHDGSATTLQDVVNRKVQALHLPQPTTAELSDLISFLRSL
jgi:cytochrome c peroxidase